jgi:hypothetical protein
VLWWVIYVIDVYVSSDPGTYMVRIRFTFQNRVWQKEAEKASRKESEDRGDSWKEGNEGEVDL